MKENEDSTSRRLIVIGGKFFLYLLGAAAIALVVDYIDYRFANYGVEGYRHSAVAAAANRDILLFIILFFLFLIVNTTIIHRNSIAETTFSQYYQSKLFRKIIIFCLVCMFTVYVVQLQKWTGKDNANLEAKQYWVAGQVLNGFRLVLTTFIHPEIPVMTPANLLQRWIYNKGTQYLPKNDGEIGVWQNSWFHYHYSRRDRVPLFIRKGKPSDLMVNLLDQEWFCLKTMATKPFADRQMEEEHYYHDYPSLAFSYSLNKGWYSGKLIASASRLAQMAKHVQRSHHLSEWLWQLRGKWRSSPKTLSFIDKHPKLEALWQAEYLFELEGLIQGEIYSRKFGCNNISTQRYLLVRREFVKGDSGHPAYRRMKSMAQSQRLYRIVVQRGNSPSIKYVLKHYCGYKVAGQEDYSKYASWAETHKITPAQEAENSVKANFYDEIKILEEMFNE